MTKTLLAVGLLAVIAGSVPAFAADTVVDTSAGTTAKVGSQVVEVPHVSSRRKMLFSFGALGTGLHMGWKRRLTKEEANGHFRGVGSPILFTSMGTHAIGVGTPKKEKVVLSDKNG